jgi:hypothetical protein
MKFGNTLWINTSLVNISSFTITNSSEKNESNGILVKNKISGISNFYTIKYIDIYDCIIKNNSNGIDINKVESIVLSNCIFFNCINSIEIDNSYMVDIRFCKIYDNGVEFDNWSGSSGGIHITNSRSISIFNCDIYSNKIHGISIWGISSNIEIHHNYINGNTWNGILVSGVGLSKPYTVHIHNNNISNNGNGYNFNGGVMIQNCIKKVTIEHNTIKSNDKNGINTIRSNFNRIIENNFFENEYNAYLEGLCFSNKWIGNYWDNWKGFGPKMIFGRLWYFGLLPWINFDWNPAQEPYDIDV